MNRGIELLIARMKSNPDEFEPSAYNVSAGSMWDSLVHDWRHCLTDEELDTYKTALKEVHRELFARKVMKHILTAGEVHEVRETTKSAYQHPYNNSNITLASPHTTAGVINVGKESLDEETIKHMREHLKHMKQMGKI